MPEADRMSELVRRRRGDHELAADKVVPESQRYQRIAAGKIRHARNALRHVELRRRRVFGLRHPAGVAVKEVAEKLQAICVEAAAAVALLYARILLCRRERVTEQIHGLVAIELISDLPADGPWKLRELARQRGARDAGDFLDPLAATGQCRRDQVLIGYGRGITGSGAVITRTDIEMQPDAVRAIRVADRRALEGVADRLQHCRERQVRVPGRIDHLRNAVT